MINKNKMWAYIWPIIHHKAIIPSVGIINHQEHVGSPMRLVPVARNYMKWQLTMGKIMGCISCFNDAVVLGGVGSGGGAELPRRRKAWTQFSHQFPWGLSPPAGSGGGRAAPPWARQRVQLSMCIMSLNLTNEQVMQSWSSFHFTD